MKNMEYYTKKTDGMLWDSRKGRELDAAGFIRAEENGKRTHIKKFVENFTFL